MTTQPDTSILHAARAWAQTANGAQIEGAHRLLRVATAASDPLVILRMLFRADSSVAHAALVESFFSGTPSRADVDAFLREVTVTCPMTTSTESAPVPAVV
jgi:hypothetical protein